MVLSTDSRPPKNSLTAPSHGEVESVTQSIGALEIGNQTQAPPTTQSSIWQLPPEVLGQIFETATSPGLSVECMKHLIDLCLVCRVWREAALAHHRLWSSLEVKVRFTPRVRDKIEAWLYRAGTVPKSLVIQSSYHQYCWYETDDLANYEDILAESGRAPCPFAAPNLARQLLNGSRLDHLSLYCPTTSCLIYLTTNLGLLRALDPPTPWDNLRSLRLVVNSEWVMDEDTQDAVDEVLQHLPPVTSLHMHVPEFKYHVHPNSPWAEQRKLIIAPSSLTRLTRLTFDCDWHYRTIFDTIRPCLNLEVLTLHLKSGTIGYNGTNDTVDSQFSPDPMKDVFFPRLEVLRLRQANPVAVRILRHFETPILTELDIGFKVGGFSWDTSVTQNGRRWQDYIGSYVGRSNCQTTIRFLRLQGIRMSSVVFRDLVADYFPRLTDLTLDDVGFRDQSVFEVLQRLTVISEPFSHLQTVRLVNLPSPPRTTQNPPTMARPRDILVVPPPRELDECDGNSGKYSKVRFITMHREETDPPQLEGVDDWGSEDSEDEEFDSWDFNLGLRESLLPTLEHDCL